VLGFETDLGPLGEVAFAGGVDLESRLGGEDFEFAAGVGVFDGGGGT